MLRSIGVGLVVLGVLSAVGALITVRTEMQEVRDAARENPLWTSGQLEIEYWRFRSSISEATALPTVENWAEANLRYNILWSRLSLYDTGDVARVVPEIVGAQAGLAEIKAEMRFLERPMEQALAGNADAQSKLSGQILGLESLVRKLHRDTLAFQQTTELSARESLLRISSVLTVAALAGGVLSLVVLFVFARDVRRQLRVAKHNRDLFEQAEGARDSKTKFLTLMSHDLRTPMNGVLGMLALAREEVASPEQELFLEEAAASARKVNTVLTNVIEISSLEREEAELTFSTFSIDELETGLTSAIQHSVTEDSAAIQLSVLVAGETRLRSDKQKVEYILSELACALAQQMPQDLHLTVDLRKQTLVAHLSTCPIDRNNMAKIDNAPLCELHDTLSSPELAPMVALGFLEFLGGKLCHLGDDGVFHKVVEIPVD